MKQYTPKGIKEDIAKEIRKYLETNKNKTQQTQT